MIEGGEKEKMASIEPAHDIKVGGKYVGKCPSCDAPLKREDIMDVYLRGTVYTHNAYVCRLCSHIIGFSAAHS